MFRSNASRVFTVLLMLPVFLACASMAGAQSAADIKRAASGLERIEQAISDLKESGFYPEAEALQSEVNRVRWTLRRMQAKPDPKRVFRIEDIMAGRDQAHVR